MPSIPSVDAPVISSIPIPRLGPSNGGPTYFAGTGDGDSPWDFAFLGGFPIPGKSSITGGKIRLKHDKKDKPGADGANPTFYGLAPQEFGLEVEVWTDDQLDALINKVCANVLPKPWSKPPTPQGQTAPAWPPPLPLSHPQLLPLMAATQIVVVVLGATPFKWSGPNMLKMTFELLHWMPAPNTKPPQVSTPPHSVAKAGNARAQADAGGRNPAPSQQPNAGGPPQFKTGT